MRHFFEALNENFGKALTPEDYISLDERLYPMKTQSAMKQYNPDKSAKYGILFKSLKCARYPYTYQTNVYAGPPTLNGIRASMDATYPWIDSLQVSKCRIGC